MNKLMLKDLIGKKDINIMIDIAIKGQKFDHVREKQNKRLLKNVYTKKDKKGEWIYIEWKPEGKILSYNDSSFNDCGYSGLLLGESHPLENLYVNIIEEVNP